MSSRNNDIGIVIAVATLIVTFMIIAPTLIKFLAVAIIVVGLIIFLMIKSNHSEPSLEGMVSLFGVLLLIFVGVILLYGFFSKNALGQSLYTTSTALVLMDGTVTEVQNNIILGLAYDLAPREKIDNYVEFQKPFPREETYPDNQSYQFYYPVKNNGSNVSFPLISTGPRIKCNSNPCEVTMKILNLKEDFVLNANLQIDIIAQEEYIQDNILKTRNRTKAVSKRNITLYPRESMKITEKISYDKKKKYSAFINPESVNLTILPNKNVTIKNVTRFRPINRTKTVTEYNTVRENQPIEVIDYTYYIFLRNLLGIVGVIGIITTLMPLILWLGGLPPFT